MPIIIQQADFLDGMFDHAGGMMSTSWLSGLALVLWPFINQYLQCEGNVAQKWLVRWRSWLDLRRMLVMLIQFMLEMLHGSLTEVPSAIPGSEESKERQVPAQLRFMASNSKEARCTKLREALQKVSKLPLLAKVELDYVKCSSDPTRSQSDIIRRILQNYVSKFEAELSTYVPLKQVSGFEDVAINCAGCLVWKPLRSSSKEFRCEVPSKLCSTAQHLVWLLEDASHEVPLFVVDFAANPLKIWDVLVAAKVQRRRFCALAVYEKLQQFKCGRHLADSYLTTSLWDTMISRFKAAELHLVEHEMIDSDLESQLNAFRQILRDLRSRWANCFLLPSLENKYYCCERCERVESCGRSLWDLTDLWRVCPSQVVCTFPNRLLQSFVELTSLMSDLTAAASKIADSLAALNVVHSPSHQANHADQETLWPDESASQVGGGSVISDSYTLLSAVGGPHCFLPSYLFKVSGQEEETFISGKDTGTKNINVTAA